MKAIQRLLFLTAVPLLAQFAACSDTGTQVEPISPNSGADGSSVSASWRASEIIGASVKNGAGNTIGDVDDLVVNMRDGEIIAVVISTGGFLGVADTLSAVPVSSLQYDRTDKEFTTNLSKDQLDDAPRFRTDAWPDYSQPTTMDRLRSFRDSIGGDVTDPDNTVRNDLEMEQNDVNSLDQGNSDTDVQITRDIRSGIMDTDMSLNAKNIKIITRDEHVTLAGVVESEAEHQSILTIVGNHATTNKITDELKVNSR